MRSACFTGLLLLGHCVCLVLIGQGIAYGLMVSSIISPLHLNKQTVSIEPKFMRKYPAANRFLYSLVKHIKRHAQSFLLQLKQCAKLETH